MIWLSPSVLGAAYGLSEVGLAAARRSGKRALHKDRQTLRILWLTILVGLACALVALNTMPFFRIPPKYTFYSLGFIIFFVGLLVRWGSILYLGRFFTVDVAIASDHELIVSGPYRYVRHPSYAGAMLAFLGLGWCFGNVASLIALTLPTFFAFRRRMQIEETALTEALGERYTSYCRRTKRLLPLVY